MNPANDDTGSSTPGRARESSIPVAVYCRSQAWRSALVATDASAGYVLDFDSGADVDRPTRETVRVSMRGLWESGIRRLVVLCDGRVGDADARGLFVVADHVNLSGDNPLIGGAGAFIDMSAAYDPDIRLRLRSAAEAGGIAVREGIAVDPPGFGLTGPSRGDWAVAPGLAQPVIAARGVGIDVGAVVRLTRSDGTTAAGEGLEADGLIRFWASAAGELANGVGVS